MKKSSARPYSRKTRGSIIAALDIGSSKIACFIGRDMDGSGAFEIVGAGNHVTAGIHHGTISDLAAAEAAIRHTVHAAEKMAADELKGYPLRSVIVNVAGVHALSHGHSADVNVSGHQITENDIRRALLKSQDAAETADHDIIHTIPVGTRIDGHDGIRDPRGMFGHAMQVDIHLATAEKAALRNITTCIERSHLDISAFCLSSYAAGLAVLVDDEMDLGCTVIDMGGGVTSFAVFQNGMMIYADAAPVGGINVTGDIARGLTTSVADAERLKILYGSAMGAGPDESELIDVPPLGEHDRGEPNHVPRSLLVGIIQPRLEETLEIVRGRLKDSGLGAAIGQRVVLTGGASQLPGLRDLSQRVLGRQVRLGRPIRLAGLPEAVSGPGFATTAGMLTYLSERSHEIPAVVEADAIPGNLWERVLYWVRANW